MCESAGSSAGHGGVVTGDSFSDVSTEVEVPVGAEQTLRGRVIAVHFSSPKFSAGKMLAQGRGEPVSFAGALMTRVGDSLVLTGKFEENGKWGMQFRVSGWSLDEKMGAAGLAHYLANHPDVKGIGPAKAAQIAHRLGDDFDRALAEDPGKLLELGLSETQVKSLQDTWTKDRARNRARLWLAGHGLSHHQIVKLVERYGDGIQAVLEENPYLLSRDVEGFGFKRADGIALKVGVPVDSPKRVKSALAHALFEASSDGHTWLPYADLVTKTLGLLEVHNRELVEGVLDLEVQRGALVGRQIKMGYAVGLKHLYQCEIELAEFFSQVAVNPHFPDVDVAREIVNGEERLNRAQRDAMMAALCRNMAVVTGGAGTGKTFTMAAIYRAYETRGLRVLLAAPTGKAAKRMSELADGAEAMTLHRMLGYSGHSYRVDRIGKGTPGPSDQGDFLPSWVDSVTGKLRGVGAVLIDEASMIDVVLARELLRAVELDQTAVIFFGDHHQLPPVGPGNMLRDLLARRPIPVVVLEEVVRQAGALKDNSIAILRGQVRPSVPAKTASAGLVETPWVVADKFPDEKRCKEYLVDLFANRIPTKLGMSLDDVQVLCPTYKGTIGADALNRAFQKVVQRRLGMDVPEGDPSRKPKPLVGDRVIQCRNNYDLGESGIMNGTVGTVLHVRGKDSHLTVRFEEEEVEYDPSEESELALAYALTIHRAQGSEWPCVVVVVHKSQKWMHSRGLLYTAVTRARKTAFLVGDAEGMAYCAARDVTESRRTWLAVAKELGGGS
jgi:exodeoxyribonuclease V alpha subunit